MSHSSDCYFNERHAVGIHLGTDRFTSVVKNSPRFRKGTVIMAGNYVSFGGENGFGESPEWLASGRKVNERTLEEGTGRDASRQGTSLGDSKI